MVIIIGAGLSGLLVGYQLKKAGIQFKIVEARNRLGGRIYTQISTNNTPIDMGATWFGPQHRNLISLIKELKLSIFEQHLDTTAYYQPFSTAPTQSIPIPPQSPSYRIKGGTSSIIDCLASKLSVSEVETNQVVKSIKIKDSKIIVEAKTTFQVSKVILALPPKLWSNTIAFEPALPEKLIGVAKHTHTWMEDSIKVAITFSVPFWKKTGKSGTLFSNSGPITEFYDHSDASNNHHALCGFAHGTFAKLSLEDRRKQIFNQLQLVFGDEVDNYLEYQEVIWSKEKYSTFPSEQELFPHQNQGNPLFNQAYFDGCLFLANTESSPMHGGYMDGAVYAANSVAKKIISGN